MGLLVVRETPRAGAGARRPGRGAGGPARGGGASCPPQRAAHRRPAHGRAAARPARRPRRVSTRRTSQGARPEPVAAARSRCATRATSRPGPRPPTSTRYLRAEPFLESDAPEIRAEAEKAAAGADDAAAARRAPRRATSTRIVEKKPTVSLPSALEVLRTRVGDCNEHTALYVAMARSLGLPARIAVGLVLPARRLLLPRLARGLRGRGAAAAGCGCPSTRRSTSSPPTPPTCGWRAAASTGRPRSCGLIGRAQHRHPRRASCGPAPTPVLVGRDTADLAPLELAAAAARAERAAAAGRSRRGAPPMIAVESLVKTYGAFRAVDGVSLDVAPGEIHGFLGPERRRQDHHASA